MTTYTSYIASKDQPAQNSVIYDFPLPGYSKEDVSVKIINSTLLVYVKRKGKEYLAYKKLLPKVYNSTTKVVANMADGLLNLSFCYENPVREISIN